MAALDFPASPTVNQLFIAGNGVTYQWNGALWLPVGGGAYAIYVSDTPPAAPFANQLWFNSTQARLYIYYNDGNSTQWVPSAPIPGTQALPSQTVLQTKIVRVTAMVTGTPASFVANDGVPVITNGIEFTTLAFTPLSASSRLIVEADVYMSHAAAPGILVAALFQDAITNALSSGITRYPSAAGMVPVHVCWDGISGSVTARTFRIRGIGNQAGVVTMNGEAGTRLGGGLLSSTLKATEVVP